MEKPKNNAKCAHCEKSQTVQGVHNIAETGDVYFTCKECGKKNILYKENGGAETPSYQVNISASKALYQ